MKRILDPSFRYTPSFETDLRRTFEKIRRQQRARIGPEQGAGGTVRINVLPLERAGKRERR
jgi:hypothetical protein